MRMRHIIIYGLSQFYGIFVPYLNNGTIFEKKKLFNMKCVL